MKLRYLRNKLLYEIHRIQKYVFEIVVIRCLWVFSQHSGASTWPGSFCVSKKSEKEPNPYFNNKQSHFAQKEPLIRFYKQPNAHHKRRNQNMSAKAKLRKYQTKNRLPTASKV